MRPSGSTGRAGSQERGEESEKGVALKSAPRFYGPYANRTLDVKTLVVGMFDVLVVGSATLARRARFANGAD